MYKGQEWRRWGWALFGGAQQLDKGQQAQTSHMPERSLNNWMWNMFCFFSPRSSVSNALRQHSHFFWIMRRLKGSIYSFCHGDSKRHEKNKQRLWWVMMPWQSQPMDGVNQPAGFFTTVLLCWKPAGRPWAEARPARSRDTQVRIKKNNKHCLGNGVKKK